MSADQGATWFVSLQEIVTVRCAPISKTWVVAAERSPNSSL